MKKKKKSTAKLIWDTKPKNPPKPQDIDLKTVEIVYPNLQK